MIMEIKRSFFPHFFLCFQRCSEANSQRNDLFFGFGFLLPLSTKLLSDLLYNIVNFGG